MKVGVLALQGAIEPHIFHIKKLGQLAVKVRSVTELQQVDRLIIPGGESSSMLNLLQRREMIQALQLFGKSNPIWGVCAGAILLASEVANPKQCSLGLMQIRAVRNYYGSHLDSFKATINIKPLHIEVQADFIRAPKLERLSEKVDLLAEHNGEEVLLRQDHLLASSFHTELGDSSELHRYFIEL